MIHLGYETGTGKAVGIPLAHMAITGQTQQSGKTTTLEALIDRGDVRAVVFVTKPGEKSFSEGRRILPYFKERADWEYVKELLEARLNESLGSKVGYLMRACSKARSLADVRKNIAAELPKKKSSRPSMYEVLAGYIDLIIAEMERVEYTDKLDLVSGVNIMVLTGMSEEMQSLVIRSTIERIHQREHHTVLVMPEAWKFIPEGGRSPVYQALHTLIREGATNGNYVWIDAQDLAVVSKRILKSVSVWVLGKQQEANEVARTINHLIEPLHIRPDMIKSLGIGQFLVCADGATKRVYVQPRWLGELDALAIARGEESVETAQAIFRQKKRALAATERIKSNEGSKFIQRRAENEKRIQPDKGKTLSIGGGNGDSDRSSSETSEVAQIENAAVPASIHRDSLRDSGQAGQAGQAAAGTGGVGVDDKNHILQRTDQDHARRIGQSDGTRHGSDDEILSSNRTTKHPVGSGGTDRTAAAGSGAIDQGNEDTMWKERAEKAEAELIELRKRYQQLYADNVAVPKYDGTSEGNGQFVTDREGQFNFIYQYVKERAENDPGILELLATRPELRVRVEPKVLEAEENTLRGGLAILIQKGFFLTPKNGNTAFNELVRLGRKIAKPNVYRELDNLAELGFVTKEADGYQATGMKITVIRD
jgi:hypothetical protein